MGVTGEIFKTLYVDGVALSRYGVYITGEAVYNSPARSVEMITIPGRDGAYARDNGNFENIIVSYPAGIFEESESRFAETISDLRNLLASRVGYVRLEDDYNPDEYRLAVYKEGLEVSPALLRAGEFVITFECKPQRFLKSGEELVTLLDTEEKLYNPTFFDAHPLLEVTGSGTLAINDEPISVSNDPLGEIVVFASGGSYAQGVYAELDKDMYNTGDALTMTGASVRAYFKGSPDASGNMFFDMSYSSDSGVTVTDTRTAGNAVCFVLALPDMTFVAGTAKEYTHTVNVAIKYTNATTGATYNAAVTITVTVRYAQNYGISMGTTYSNLQSLARMSTAQYPNEVIADSSVIPTDIATYIDLDIGEAYTNYNSETLSANDRVTLPAELPALRPGDNIITYGGGIEHLGVVPRWWKV